MSARPTPEELVLALVKDHGEEIMSRSAAIDVRLKRPGAASLTSVLAGQHYGVILEIGTHKGVSAAILSHFADLVVTIDVEAHPEVRAVLDAASALDRVVPIVVMGDGAKRRLVDALQFDAAFVDGCHDADAVAADVEMTRRCGRLLLHDAMAAGPGHVLAALEVGDGRVERFGSFAWWTASGEEAS